MRARAPRFNRSIKFNERPAAGLLGARLRWPPAGRWLVTFWALACRNGARLLFRRPPSLMAGGRQARATHARHTGNARARPRPNERPPSLAPSSPTARLIGPIICAAHLHWRSNARLHHHCSCAISIGGGGLAQTSIKAPAGRCLFVAGARVATRRPRRLAARLQIGKRVPASQVVGARAT